MTLNFSDNNKYLDKVAILDKRPIEDHLKLIWGWVKDGSINLKIFTGLINHYELVKNGIIKQ